MAGGPVSFFEIAAILVGLSALFGYLNHRYLKAPPTIGLVLIGLGVGTTLLLAQTVLPAAEVDAAVVGVLVNIDFHELLMHGMLSFLLFAGALHVDIPALRCRWRTVSAMATVGTVVSTALVAGGIWLVASLAGHPLPFVWALVFGALISPTDPVAVLGLFESVRVPPTLKAALEGESLFNDGVGVVVFTVLLGVALQDTDPGLWHVGELFLVEVAGGAALGIALGYAGYRGVLGIEEPNLELLVTLGIVMVGYAAAVRFGVSGPIAMVVAGLFFGGQGMRRAVSPASRDYLRKFWSLLDNVLNSVLFLLIGLEVLVVAGAGLGFWWASLAAIPVVLATRWLSVALARTVLHRWEAFEKGAVTVLTWGGLRGGIAVALALSLPASEHRPFILAVTYAVVVFSIVGQGLTVARVTKWSVFSGSSEPAP